MDESARTMSDEEEFVELLKTAPRSGNKTRRRQRPRKNAPVRVTNIYDELKVVATVTTQSTTGYSRYDPFAKLTKRLKHLGYASYSEYLRSEHWQATRERYRLSKLPQQCYVCGNSQYELHHRTYKNLGHEFLRDFVPLCRICHQAVHDFLTELAAHGYRPDLYRGAKRLKRRLTVAKR